MAVLKKAIPDWNVRSETGKVSLGASEKIATLNEARRLISQPDVESQYPSLVIHESCSSIADY
jgi:hypothetical protein